MTTQVTTEPAPSPIELYTQGYRAKRLTERTGAVKEPDGTVHRFYVYAAVCTCRPRIEQTPGDHCIHLRMYTALRFIQLGKRIEKRKAEELAQRQGTATI